MPSWRPREGRAEARVVVDEVVVQCIPQAVTSQVLTCFIECIGEELGINVAIELEGTEARVICCCLQILLSHRCICACISTDINTFPCCAKQFGPGVICHWIVGKIALRWSIPQLPRRCHKLCCRAWQPIENDNVRIGGFQGLDRCGKICLCELVAHGGNQI